MLIILFAVYTCIIVLSDINNEKITMREGGEGELIVFVKIKGPKKLIFSFLRKYSNF